MTQPARATQFDTIALSGSSATASLHGPGLGAGVTFDTFSRPPILNENGRVAFIGGVAGTGIDNSNRNAVFTHDQDAGTLSLVARSGATGPGPNLGPGRVFTDFSTVYLNSAGHAAFFGFATGDFGMFSNVGGTVTAQSLTGTATGPGPNLGSDIRFGSMFASIAFSDSGSIAFRGSLTGTGVNSTNDRGLFVASGGRAHAIAREGALGPGPGLGSGVVFDLLQTPTSINAAGTVAFSSRLAGTGVHSANDHAIFTNAGGPVAPIARQGSTVFGPGMGPGFTFGDLIFQPKINAAGTVAFVGPIAGPGVSSSNYLGIFTHTAGVTKPVARIGDTDLGPQLGAGVHFADFENPVLNGSNDLAFVATLTGSVVNTSSDSGIFANVGGTIRAIAREGPAGPGPNLGPGVNFDAFGPPPVLNAAGDVAFVGTLTGAGVTAANDIALFTNAGGTLATVVREGDLFDVDPGTGIDLRTIGSLSFASGGGDGSEGFGQSFTESRLLTFGLTFTDGSSGIFTAIVPEPTAVICLAPATLLLLTRRRRG